MMTGLEAMALKATDILSASRAAQQITSPLARAGSSNSNPDTPVNPSEVKVALDKASSAIEAVQAKLVECSEIICSLNDISPDEIQFNIDFPKELKVRAQILSDHIENLRDVFSLIEKSHSWKPYQAAILERKTKAIRAVSNLRNAYLNIALIAEQFVSPVPAIDSDNTGNLADYHSAISASVKLLEINKPEWM